jgi:hypothetical protein
MEKKKRNLHTYVGTRKCSGTKTILRKFFWLSKGLSRRTIWWYYTRRSRSQWPRCLRHGTAAACLLGLGVPFPTGDGYLSVFECVLSGRGVQVVLVTVHRSPTECGVSECVIAKSIRGGHDPEWDHSTTREREREREVQWFINRFLSTVSTVMFRRVQWAGHVVRTSD